MIDSEPLLIQPTLRVLEALQQMGHRPEIKRQSSPFPQPSNRSSYALIVDAGNLLGILTERDIVRLTVSRVDLSHITVADVMTRQLITSQEADLDNPFLALSIFRKHHIRHLPVLNAQQKVIGVVTPNSVRRSLKSTDLLSIRQVREVMSRNVVTALPDVTVLELAELMTTHRVSCVVITESSDSTAPAARVPIGIVTERDIVQFQALALDLNTIEAQTVMSTPLVCLKPEDDLWHVHQTMERLRIRRLVITDEHTVLAGIVTQTSILRALDPIVMQNTIMILQQEVEQLKNEQTQLLQRRTLQLENQVNENEERFQAIFNQTFQFIGFLTPAGILLEANQTALEFAGLKREEVINRPFWETYWWQISSSTQQQLKHAIAQAAQGEFIRYEVDVQGAGNQIITIDFSLRPILDETGRVKWLIPEGRDISDLKRSQEDLQQSQKHYANLAEAAPVGIFQTDAEGNCCYVNEKWCQIAGLSAAAVMGTGWVVGLHPDDRPQVADEWYRTAKANELFHMEYRFQSPSGQVTWVLGQAVSETDINGQINGYIGTISDITHRKQAEVELNQYKSELESRIERRTLELKISRKRHADMYQKTPVMLHSIDWQGRIRHVSDYWLEQLGYTREEVIGHQSTEFLTPESRHYAETVVLPDYFKTGFCSDIPYQVVSKNGKVIDVLLSATNQQDDSGERSSLAVMIDVTARNQELYREKELAQVTLQSIADAVITTDAHGYVKFINPIAEELTGWKADEAKGMPLTSVFHIINEVTRLAAENPVDRVLHSGQICGLANHTALISKNGIEYSIEDSAAPIRSRVGDIIGAVMVFHDVTQSRQLQRELSWQASHDRLTGLFNRQKFEQEVEEILKSSIQAPPGHVVLCLDLDQFKVVNDTCGHMGGDELLCQISQLLKKQIRAIDTLARMGGDEFGILLRQCSLESSTAIAEKILATLQNFRFIWQDKVFNVGVSIGVVCVDTDHSLTDILSAADSACYAAKHKGRNRIHVYEPDDSELLNQRGESRLSLQIKQALVENRFCLYRQAIACTTQSNITTYEVLVRMIDVQGNLIPPGLFIPIAERYSLMQAIDRWVIRTFFTYMEEAFIGDNSKTKIDASIIHFINLSGNSIGDPLFLEFIKEEFRQHTFSSYNIGFEITETAAISNLQQAEHFIIELKQLGCKFSLDDFGSGMSSLGYLKNLSVDYLKIDGHFIKDILSDPTTNAIVESINHIGHVMGLKTIAEYVETQPLQEQLKVIGVDYVQGFGIARPESL